MCRLIKSFYTPFVLVFIFTNLSGQINKSSSKVTFECKITDTAKYDKFILVITDCGGKWNNKNISETKQIYVDAKNNSFSYTVDSISANKYVTLYALQNASSKKNFLSPNGYASDLLLYYYLIQPGDSISINATKRKKYGNVDFFWSSQFNMSFTGRNVAKYRIWSQLDNFDRAVQLDRRDYKYEQLADCKRSFDALYLLKDGFLNQFNSSLSVEERQILKVNSFADTYVNFVSFAKNNIPDSLKHQFKKQLNSLLDDLRLDQKLPLLKKSSSLCDLVLDIELTKVRYDNSSLDYIRSYIKTLDIIGSRYQGEIRDILMSRILIARYRFLKDSDEFDLQKYTSKIENVKIRESILRNYAGSRIGIGAFNFRFKDSEGKNVRMSDFKGKVVFIDFWFTGCSNCITYYNTILKDVENNFKRDTNVVFISICIDLQKEMWIASLNSGKYTSRAVINLNTGEGSDLDNSSILKYYNITYYPKPLLFDRNQKLVSTSDVLLRNGQSLIEVIEKELIKRKSNL